MKKNNIYIITILFITLCVSTILSVQNFQTNKSTTPKEAYSATTSVIPNPPPWFSEITDTLRNFLEQLYLTVNFFHLPSNMAYLLDGLGDGTVPTPTSMSPSPTQKPGSTPTKTPTPNVTTAPISGGLHISGTTLMTSNNQRFIVKGANVEMYRDSGCSDITNGQYAARTQMAQKFKSLGVNAIRLNYSLSWLGQSAANQTKYLDFMQALAAQGIYSMPSDHAYTGKSLSGSSASYDLFGKIIAGAKSRGIENYLMMNPYNEPYSSANWTEWESENKKTVTYLRSTANFKGPIVLDTPSWAASVDNDLSSYNVLINHDKSLMNGVSNIVFSNHWYPNIALSNPQNAASKASSVPVLIGEIGQINPGASGLNPQYTKDVLSNAIAAMPNGHNGVFPWIWNWCDENNMTNDDYVTLNTFGQLIDTNYYKKF